MKRSWLRSALILLAASLIVLPVSTSAGEEIQPADSGMCANFFLRSAGGTSLLSIPVYPEPYRSYYIRATSTSGTGFELEKNWSAKLVSHLRLDLEYMSGDQTQESDNWEFEPDTTLTGNRVSNSSASRTDWSISLDGLYEPFGRPMIGNVRTRVGVGPYVSLISSSTQSDSKTISLSTNGNSGRYLGEENTDAFEWQAGLRAQFAAEYWFNSRMAFVCRTSIAGGWFAEENERTSTYRNYTTPLDQDEYLNRRKSTDTTSEDGWWMGMEGILAGFTFQL